MHGAIGEALGLLMIVWVVSLWVAQLAWCAMGARARGRDPGLWAMLALLYGPLAMVGLIVAGDSRTAAAPAPKSRAQASADAVFSNAV